MHHPPPFDTIKILSSSSFSIKSRHELYPLTFTTSLSLSDLPIASNPKKVVPYKFSTFPSKTHFFPSFPKIP